MTTLKFLLLLLLIMYTTSGEAGDTIDGSHAIRDGDTIVSSGGMYELGFFSPGSSTNRYVGIWFKTIPYRTVIWVANREAPLPSKSGLLTISQPAGNLVLLNETNGTVWSTNASGLANTRPVAQLLDSGNLVITDGAGNYLWQSFDHPGDTFVPGLKFGQNLVTGLETYLTSWKSSDDPAPGDYTHRVELTGYPQMFTMQNGAVITRVGPWNALPDGWRTNPLGGSAIKVLKVMNQTEVSLNVEAVNTSVIFRLNLAESGYVLLYVWVEPKQEWNSYRFTMVDDCDHYSLCGPYGLCDVTATPLCRCLDGFVQKSPENWAKADFSDGCIPRTNLSCKSDGFLKLSGVKLPDARNSVAKEGLSMDECQKECLNNCTCMGFSLLNMTSKTGCLFWFGQLTDIRKSVQQGFDMHVRVSASELGPGNKKRKILIGALTSAMGVVFIALIFVLVCIWRKKKKKKKKKKRWNSLNKEKRDSEELEVPLFRYSDILEATDHFSWQNKLGEGGFGPVFKGTLKDGQEIAVKCLSMTSTQGIHEFKNEANFIAKVQHRNLVRLLGCCIQKDQNILIYEYMHHKSLDLILFDETKKELLNWPKRFHVINGVARGLLYLHHDSQLRIIHRDLKASNILLDSNLNPKISDFGTARSFRETEIATITNRVVGTRGYMSPEYAIDGLFSVKSDVFSFGVLVLEIVSGQRNREFAHSDHYLNLLGHAWTLYKEGRPLELLDKSLADECNEYEVLRSIHVGLLCVQRMLDDRPTMSFVMHMLSSDGILPPPNQPGYFIERDISIRQSSMNTTSTTNEVTITLPEGR